MSIFVLGIDLGKNVCSLVGLNEAGAVVLRRRLRRDRVSDFVCSLPACIVAMEACCGAHHVGRVLGAIGHVIRLMSPEYVRPYVKATKTMIATPRRSRTILVAPSQVMIRPDLKLTRVAAADSTTAAHSKPAATSPM